MQCYEPAGRAGAGPEFPSSAFSQHLYSHVKTFVNIFNLVYRIEAQVSVPRDANVNGEIIDAAQLELKSNRWGASEPVASIQRCFIFRLAQLFPNCAL